jgi:hypothetical protein
MSARVSFLKYSCRQQQRERVVYLEFLSRPIVAFIDFFFGSCKVQGFHSSSLHIWDKCLALELDFC